MGRARGEGVKGLRYRGAGEMANTCGLVAAAKLKILTVKCTNLE